MKDLRGRTAIVTGASRGIGVYIAKALAERGVNLSLAARSIDELEVVRNQMEALGVRALATECDVTDGSARHRLVERTESELGPVDILVNNAGIETIGHFEQADDAATREPRTSPPIQRANTASLDSATRYAASSRASRSVSRSYALPL